jgi:hypothetical protein
MAGCKKPVATLRRSQRLASFEPVISLKRPQSGVGGGAAARGAESWGTSGSSFQLEPVASSVARRGGDRLELRCGSKPQINAGGNIVSTSAEGVIFAILPVALTMPTFNSWWHRKGHLDAI